jgi:hypothetical protein
MSRSNSMKTAAAATMELIAKANAAPADHPEYAGGSAHNECYHGGS